MRPTSRLSIAVTTLLLLAGCSAGPAGATHGAAPDLTASTSPCVTTVASTPEDPLAEPARLMDVRLEPLGRADRIGFTFAGDAVPAFEIAPAEPPFVQDASGLPVDVPGRAFLRVRFPFATGMETYEGPAALVGSGSGLVSLVRTGDFEAVLTWVVGTSAPSCVRVSTLDAPVRLILDVEPAP